MTYIPSEEKRQVFTADQIQCFINTESDFKTAFQDEKIYEGVYICRQPPDSFFRRAPPKTIQHKNESIFTKFYQNYLSLAIWEDLNLEFDIEIPKLYKQYTDEILPEDRYVGFSLKDDQVDLTHFGLKNGILLG